MDMARTLGWMAVAFFFCAEWGAEAGVSSNSIRHIPLVPDFDLGRYLGTWHEIARLPHRFERDLEQVTATYRLREDGRIRVINRGLNTTTGRWSEAEGRAWVPDPKIPARLKVSFFLFFAADYRVVALDPEDYSYTMVTSGNKKYLWILSRRPSMNEVVYRDLVKKARGWGFEVDQLIRVRQKEGEKREKILTNNP